MLFLFFINLRCLLNLFFGGILVSKNIPLLTVQSYARQFKMMTNQKTVFGMHVDREIIAGTKDGTTKITKRLICHQDGQNLSRDLPMLKGLFLKKCKELEKDACVDIVFKVAKHVKIHISADSR
jgi:hypothetical protein